MPKSYLNRLFFISTLTHFSRRMQVVSIHLKNLRFLLIEAYKIINRESPSFLLNMFELKPSAYSKKILWHILSAYICRFKPLLVSFKNFVRRPIYSSSWSYVFRKNGLGGKLYWSTSFLESTCKNENSLLIISTARGAARYLAKFMMDYRSLWHVFCHKKCSPSRN